MLDDLTDTLIRANLISWGIGWVERCPKRERIIVVEAQNLITNEVNMFVFRLMYIVPFLRFMIQREDMEEHMKAEAISQIAYMISHKEDELRYED